jgi:cytochrome c oxidase cbb3-type subunit III
MSNEQERLLEHDYDGIREYDNPTPRWWTWIFWGSVVFSIVYFINPAGMRGQDRITTYNASIAAANRRWPKGPASADVAALSALRSDPNALALGKTTFGANCAACHRLDGGGLIGPNLTDDYWIHGGSLAEMHKTVTEGVLDKGMPPWGKLLKPEQVNAVVVYVASLHGTMPKDPKPAQGILVTPDASSPR